MFALLVPVSLAAHGALQAGCWAASLLQVEIVLSVTLCCYALQFHPVSAALFLSSSNSGCMTWSPLTLCRLFMVASFYATSFAKVNNKTFKNACHSLVLGELCCQPASSPVIWLLALCSLDVFELHLTYVQFFCSSVLQLWWQGRFLWASISQKKKVLVTQVVVIS